MCSASAKNFGFTINALSLVSDDYNQLTVIARSLRDWGCCSRCVLRFLGEKEQFTYKHSLQDLTEVIDDLIAWKEDAEQVKISDTTENHKGNKDVADSTYTSDSVTSSQNNTSHPVDNEEHASEKRQKVSDNEVVDSSSKEATQAVLSSGSGDAQKSENPEIEPMDADVSNSDSVAASTDQHMTDCSNGAQSKSDSIVKEAQSSSNKFKGDSSTTESKASSDCGSGVTDPVCVTCLGLLQPQYSSPAFVQKICDMVKGLKAEFSDFYCALTLPVAGLLREHAVWVLLRKMAPDVYWGLSTADMQPVKDIWKWVNGSMIADKLGSTFDQKSTFEINLYYTHAELEKECHFLFTNKPETFKKRKTTKGMETFTRASVGKAIEDMSHDRFKACYQCPPVAVKTTMKCEMTCQHEAIFVAGRYNKYSRELSQTPWFIGGVRKTESSIEEYICDILKVKTHAAEFKFSSAGREDVDTRMLGNGRPFVVEIIKPLNITFTQEDYTKFQLEINAATKDIQVKDLQHVTKDDIAELKKGEEEKTKSYSALCWSETEFSQQHLDSVLLPLKDIKLQQKTPVRVLHRRPLATRPKVIHNISAKKQEDKNYFRLYLSTEAGTYIKEFVHGDFGRTKPNLGILLGADCDIMELDVESVELDWPPPISVPIPST